MHKSKNPVANFFINREIIRREFTKKEITERKEKGQSIDPYVYERVDFVMMGDHYQHMWKMYPILKDEREYHDKDWYKEAKRTPKSKTDDEGFYKNIQVYRDVCHDGAEVDSFNLLDIKDQKYE